MTKRKKILSIILVILFAGLAFLYFKSAVTCAKKYPVKGIDVSHHQKDIDWQEVESQGISFAYIKATEGSTFVDEKLEDNYIGSSATDIYYGFYHFLSFESSPEAQMQNFSETIADYDMKLIPVIDVEWYGDMKRNPPEKEIVLQQVKEMTALMENEYGCKPLIYTTQSFYKKYFEGESLDNPLWIRNILFEPSQDFVIWQYTERFRIENATDEYIDGDVTDEERFEQIKY